MIGLSIFLGFWKIGTDQINNYDEARHGVSAYEMTKTGDPLVTTFLYEPDYYNLKPPLSEYVIALGYRLFGNNALGLRFFSALAWVFSAIITSVYSWVKKGKWAGIASLLTYLASYNLLLYHCARTGDADGMYLLCSTIAVVSLLLFLDL